MKNIFYFLVKKYDIVNVSWKDVLDVYEGKMKIFKLPIENHILFFIKK